MRSWFRRHPRRGRVRFSRKAAASAVAVLFILLIVVAAINAYLVTTLPQLMASDEFQHALQVETQIEQIQGDILAEAAHPNTHFVVNAPIAMQSQSEPPFGMASTSTVFTNPAPSAEMNFSYKINQTKFEPPNWGVSGACGLPSSIIVCTGSGALNVTYNFTLSHSSLAINVQGCGNGNAICYLTYNVNGSYDNINVSVGGNSKVVNVVVNGSYDNLVLYYQGSTKNTPHEYVVFFGQDDTYEAFVGGGGTANNLWIQTSFIGVVYGALCPSGDLSATDHYQGISIHGTKGVSQNVTWYHASGTFPPPHTVPVGAANSGNSETFSNRTGIIPCAWQVISGNGDQEGAIGGLFDSLGNRYFPAMSVNFEQGAVIAGTSENNSTMLSGVPLTVTNTVNGYVVNITFVQLIASETSKAAGGGIIYVATYLMSSHTIQFVNSASNYASSGLLLATPFNFTITTPFPHAWITFFKQYPSVFQGVTQTDCHTVDGTPVCDVVVPTYALGGFNVRVITAGLSLNT